jgi:PD-(D/E)XK nuclease superfamily
VTRAVGQSAGAIRDFLGRYRDARQKQIEQQAQRLSAQLGHIRKGLESAKQRRAEHSRLVAPDLNVFNILRVADQEFAHSNFIAELLDPQGTHGQGTLFLDHF